MKTILVIGASGFMGASIVEHLRKRHKVIAAFSRNVVRFPGVSHFMYQLTERDYMKRMITITKPDVIIYAAGMTDFMECATKPQLAEAINSFGPMVIAAAADTLDHRFIFLSTCYVYDGRKGNFLENDVATPATVYGKSKLAGENYVRSKVMCYSVLRMSPIYGLGSAFHRSHFDQIRAKLQRGQVVELADKELHSFLSMDVALRAIEWVATGETQNKTYNLGGLTKLSWYEFGKVVAQSFGFDSNLVMPGKGAFEEHMDFSLNGSELVRQLQIDPLVLEQGLDLLKKELIRGAPPSNP